MNDTCTNLWAKSEDGEIVTLERRCYNEHGERVKSGERGVCGVKKHYPCIYDDEHARLWSSKDPCRPKTACLGKDDGTQACALQKTEFEACSQLRECGSGMVCARNPGRTHHKEHSILFFVSWEGKGWTISPNECECAPEDSIKALPLIATESKSDAFMKVRCPAVPETKWARWRQVNSVPEQVSPIPRLQAWIGHVSGNSVRHADILEMYQQVQVHVDSETREQITVDVERLRTSPAEMEVLQRVLEKVQSDSTPAPYHQSLALLGRAIMRADDGDTAISKLSEDMSEAATWYFIRVYRELLAKLLAIGDQQNDFLDNEARMILRLYPKAASLSDRNPMDFLSEQFFAWLFQWYLALFGTLQSGMTADNAAQVLPYFWVLASSNSGSAAPMLQRRAAVVAVQKAAVAVPKGKCDNWDKDIVTFADLVEMRESAKHDPRLELECIVLHYFKGMMMDLKDEGRLLSLVKTAFGCTREYSLSTDWEQQLELYAALC